MTTVTNNRVGRSVVDKFGKGSLKDSSLSTKSFAVALRAILTSMLFLFFWGEAWKCSINRSWKGKTNKFGQLCGLKRNMEDR